MGNTKGSTIGAKVLHEKEIEQSLPTYGKLTEQIEAVRPIAKEYRANQRNSKHGQSDFILPQVINNFSILGSRGTGKSSILKTLYQHLQAQNTNGSDYKKQKNILLPTIIPENLVENVSLMGCILGLLNDTVNQICNSKENNHSICPSSLYPLKKTYTDLMREFVQLQQPYEQISIQQFSTNSEYTRVITSMLEAGNQFAQKFRLFIDQLLDEYADDALLFIFIDDIDLSTNRCGDLVKTLLSYLSHPAIVTVLAGDISIFGEALTLDFLHNEQIPDTEFLEKIFLVEKSQYGNESIAETMLDRKKQLAYEYLKKVMPPNNRHFIVNWSLTSKRNFCIIQEDKERSQDNKKPDTLASLLHRLDRHIPMLHGYFLDWEQSSHNVDERQDALLYYPFDTTARGLVSSYRAIQLLVEKLDYHHNENETINLQEFYADIKFLIESVVASNYELSIHQHLIFEQFLDLGNTLENSNVRFDNYYMWLIQSVPYFEYMDGDRVSPESLVSIKLEITAFQLFSFLDWTSRLLGKKDILSGEEYEKVKSKILFLLCVNGYINEGNLCLNEKQRKQFRKLSETNIYLLSTILNGFYDLPFPIAVRYFQSFNISAFLGVTQKRSKEIHELSSEMYMEYAVEYIEALESYYGSHSSNLGQYVKRNPEMLEFLEDLLNHKHENLILSTLCRDYFYNKSYLYKFYITSGCYRDNSCEDLKLIFDLKPIENGYLHIRPIPNIPDNIKNYICQLPIKGKSDIDIDDNWNKYIYKEWLNFVIPSANSNKLTPFYNTYLKYAEKLFDKYGKLTKLSIHSKDELLKLMPANQQQIQIIYSIDDNNLWNIDDQFLGEENLISLIQKYIVSNLQLLEQRIMGAEYFSCTINMSSVRPIFNSFISSYDGISDTIASKCKRNLKTVLGDQPFENGITTSQYIACILILNRLIYSDAWYGKEEAKSLRNKLQSCKCNIFHCMENDKQNTISQYFFWLHCYCRYQAAHLLDSMYGVLERAANAMESVQEGIKASDQTLQVEYINMFAEKLGMNSDEIEAIPKLFELPKKKESK